MHLPDNPTYDWAQQDSIASSARYDQAAGAVDTGAPGVGIAMGFAAANSAFQVGQDAYWQRAATYPGPADAFTEASEDSLAGSAFAPGPQVDAAVETPIGSSGTATLLVSVARSAPLANSALAAARAFPFGSVLAAKHDLIGSWLKGCPLPASPDPPVKAIARRAEISVWQAIDKRGPIVASIATQAPYGEDWIRDGSFINYLLDMCGHHREVARHDIFYADVQVRKGKPSPPGTAASVPPGNWAMNYYADGTVGGEVPWEIDETGFGTWTLVEHYEMTHDKSYLAKVYPAVKAAADFLAGPGKDPATGLTIKAHEDDNPVATYPPTMHASGPVLLALRSAVIAARALGHRSDESRFQARTAQLEQAMNSHYHAAGDGRAWSTSFENGGWALWPVVVASPRSDRMKAQAEEVWKEMEAHFEAPNGPITSGSYEATGLLGLAAEGQALHDRAMLNEANRGLEWIAHVEAIPGTNLLGESWAVVNGVVATGVSQPHVWELTLFTLTALELWGPVRPAHA